LIWLLGVAGLLPLLALLILTLFASYRTGEERATAELQERAQMLGVGVSILLEEATGTVRELAALPDVARALHSPEALDHALAFLGQFLIHSEGRFLAFEIFGRDQEPLGAVREGHPEAANRPQTLPLRTTLWGPQGQPAGRLVACYDAYRIAAQTLRTRIEDGGVAALLADTGEIICSTQGNASRSMPSAVVPSLSLGFPACLTAELEGKQQLVAVAPVPDAQTLMIAGSAPLSILVAQPLASIHAAAHRQSTTILYIGAIILVFLLLATAMLTRRISNPLGRLTSQVRRVQETYGTADEQATSAVKTENEVKLLSSAFDSMTARVAANQEQLQRQNVEMQAMVDELQRAHKLKDDFMSFLSHEVRTPLASIRSFAEILRTTEKIDRTDSDDFLSIIEGECDRLTLLCNDLLDFAKIQSGDMPWRDELLSVGEVIDTVLKTASALAARRSVHVLAQHAHDLPPLHADRDRLIQLLTNLVSNALKFTPIGGQVTIRAAVAREDGERVLRLTVIDTGPGIPEDFLDKIFDPFIQAPQSLKDEARGTGLGLSICMNIVKHYRGRIYAENVEQGGASIHVDLPLSQAVESLLEPEKVA
jgi:signal transduction histidine kinase